MKTLYLLICEWGWGAEVAEGGQGHFVAQFHCLSGNRAPGVEQ